ncbi:MAG: hypothetical protein AB1758_14500 [Candidatus Eremiobacterota bacterium]
MCLGLLGLVLAALAVVVRQSAGVHRHVSGRTLAQRELSRARVRLEADLRTASASEIRTGLVPPSLAGGAADGCALWFLSAVDPASGQVVRDTTGSPFWQRNILYYLVVPAGDSCAGGVGPGGLDDRCPHKVLVRKVIDSGVPTSPTTDPSTTEESLLPDVSLYLDRPVGVSTTGLGGPGLEQVQLAASSLLWFEASLGPPLWNGAVQLDLRAVSLEEAGPRVTLGSQPMATSPYTFQTLLGISPGN